VFQIKDKTIVYSDNLNDDFAGIKRKTVRVDSTFPFIRKNIFFKLAAFFVYRIIMTPVAYLYCKIKFGLTIKGKKVLKCYRKNGYFLYGNHTQIPADGFIPNMINFPMKTFFIVHADNISKKGTKNIMQMLGVIPIPTLIKAYPKFTEAIERRVLDGGCVVIYPEAHIWPYYTGIRPFGATSFTYPVKFSDPTFCFTVTYSKRTFRKMPKITVYIDGPFFPDDEIPLRDKTKNLRDKVYSAMVERAKNSSYNYIEYKKQEAPIK